MFCDEARNLNEFLRHNDVALDELDDVSDTAAAAAAEPLRRRQAIVVNLSGVTRNDDDVSRASSCTSPA